MGIIDINKLTSNNPKEFMGLFNIYNQNDINFQFVEDTQWFLGKQFIKIPKLSEESFNFIKREYPENYEAKTYAAFNWFYYKHLILPILLYALCEDTNPSIKDGNVILNATASMSVMNNINKFIRLENDISIWSYNDCSQEKFEELYEKTKNAIIDDPIKLSILASGQKPERNKPCPCGSNKKYKKCHGKNN